MNKVKAFLKSKTFKWILAIIVLIGIIYFSMLQYQKYVYNGMTKKEVARAIAEKKEKSIKDSIDIEAYMEQWGYPDKKTAYSELGRWYRANYDKSYIDSAWVESELTSFGVDTVKHDKAASNLVQDVKNSFTFMW